MTNGFRTIRPRTMGMASPLRQGYHPKGCLEHVYHKERTGTVRSTCCHPKVARAVPDAPSWHSNHIQLPFREAFDDQRIQDHPSTHDRNGQSFT